MATNCIECYHNTLCYFGEPDGNGGCKEFKPLAPQPEKPDNVNHPKHYETGKYECIDVMGEALGIENQKGFCLCNAFKYLYRCTKKHDSPIEDVKKAIWYLRKYLELEEVET